MTRVDQIVTNSTPLRPIFLREEPRDPPLTWRGLARRARIDFVDFARTNNLYVVYANTWTESAYVNTWAESAYTNIWTGHTNICTEVWNAGQNFPDLSARTLALMHAAIGEAVNHIALLCEGRDQTAQSWEPESDPPATTLQKFERALELWRGVLAPHLLSSMTRHVRRLLADEDELEQEGVTPSLSSFDSLLTFLSNRPWVKSPAVGMDRRGMFAISWTAAQDAKADITLQFLPDETVRWFVVDATGRKVISGAGTVLPEQVDSILAMYKASGWWLAA